MKNAAALFSLLVLTLPNLSFALNAPSGALTASLKSAGATIEISKLPEGGKYDAFSVLLLKGIQGDGQTALNAIRGIGAELNGVADAIKASVNHAVDPNHKFDNDTKTIFDFLDAKENAWAHPLFQYTNGDDGDDEQIYVTVNRELRAGRLQSKKTSAWVPAMRTALTHLPAFSGVSFRGTRMLEAKANQLFVAGKPATDAAFVSTSLFPETAFNFARPGVNGPDDKSDAQKIALVFVIYAKTSRPISYFAHMSAHEQELLFANGTPMTVSAKSAIFTDSDLGKTQVIVLTEN